MATAFAVFSATDDSLTFYKRDAVPSVGSTFEGKAVTSVYTGFETAEYGSWENPWVNDFNTVRRVKFADVISPVSLAYWFEDHTDLEEFDGTNLDCSLVTSMKYMFSGCGALTSVSLDLSNATALTTTMYMFNQCTYLPHVNLRGMNAPVLADVRNMFRSCLVLKSVDFSGAHVAGLTQTVHMFSGCTLLDGIDLTGFDVSQVTTMNYMFSGCAGLTALDLSNFDSGNVSTATNMFNGCVRLTTIYVSDRWSTEAMTNSTGMFTGCSALVGGNGTAYNASVVDATYARVDTAEAPGYFTYKRYVDRGIEYIIKAGALYDIAEAIREKTGSTDSLTPSQMVEAVGGLKSLPVLSNPATAENIETGFEAIDGLGAVIVGTSNKVEVVTGTFTVGTETGAEMGGFTLSNAIGKKNVVYFRTGSVTNTGLAWGRVIDGTTRSIKVSGSKPTADNVYPKWNSTTGVLGTIGATTNTFGIGSYVYYAW